MASIVFRDQLGLSGQVSIFDGLAGFSISTFTSPTRVIWNDGQPGNSFNQVSAFGTGFTYNPLGVPTAGTVTSVVLFDTHGDPQPLMSASNFSKDLAVLSSSNGAFFDTLLEGETDIAMGISLDGIWGDRQGAEMYADTTLANDKIKISISSDKNFRIASGDVTVVVGHFDDEDLASPRTTLRGGDDTLIGAGYGTRMAGDSFLVRNEGILYGGADTIDLTSATGVSYLELAGDTGTASEGATIFGGNDIIIGPSGRVSGALPILSGDVFYVESSVEPFNGTTTVNGGNDTIRLIASAMAVGDVIVAGFGTVINGGNDKLRGGESGDWLVGDVYVLESFDFNAGDDTLNGGGGNDRLWGDVALPGSSTLDGGDDVLYGGEGNDVLDGGLGNDRIYGQGGSDTVSFEAIQLGVIVDLFAGTATGQGIDIIRDVENTVGSSEADIIIGSAVSNRLTGNAGADTFVFSTALNPSTNVDFITDFDTLEDSITLDDAIFTTLPAGLLDPAAFAYGSSASTSDIRIIYDTANGNLYYDADGLGGASALRFAKLTAGLALDATHFQVV